MGNAKNEVQTQLDQAYAQQKLGDALNRLHANPDFKLVILDGFLRDDPARLVRLLADPSTVTQEQRNTIQTALQGVAQLHSYFMRIEHGCMVASAGIPDLLEELNREDEPEDEESEG